MESDEAENTALEVSLRAWLANNLPQHASSLSDQSVSLHDCLKSGVVLCEMINVIKPGGIKRISTVNTAYKQMENIQNYLTACKFLGMQASQVFDSADLVNNKFKSSLLINLSTLRGIQDRFSKNSSISRGQSSTSLNATAPVTASPRTNDPNSSANGSNSTANPPNSTISASSSSSSLNTHASTQSSNNKAQETIQKGAAANLVTKAGPVTTSANEPSDGVYRSVINTKPDNSKVALVQRWIETLIGAKCPPGVQFFDWLKPGVILCQILNTIRPGLVKSIYEGNIGYKQLENVQKYLKAIPIIVGAEISKFVPPDLTEERDLSAVTNHLHAVITVVQRDSKWAGPTLESVRYASGDSSNVSSPRHSDNSSHDDSTASASVPKQDYSVEHPKATNGLKSQEAHSEVTQTKSLQNHSPQTTPPVAQQIPAPLSEVTTIPAAVSQLPIKSDPVAVEASVNATSNTAIANTASKSAEAAELEQARRELEAAKLAMQEERRLFAERMQKEMEARAKLEEETTIKIRDERRKSMSIQALLEEERRAREVAEAEKQRIAAEKEKQKQQLAEEAERQLQAVAQRLQQETTNKLEALANKITSEALQKTEQELKKKDDHLLKQIERERQLRTRLDQLEDEKKSLSKTFEAKFKAMESELKATKIGEAPKTELDPTMLAEFKQWNSQWSKNKALTRQLTRTLTSQLQDSSSIGDDEPPVIIEITPRSPIPEEDESPRSDSELDESSASDTSASYTKSPRSIQRDSDDQDDDGDSLDSKRWLDDDWSEEEDWDEEMAGSGDENEGSPKVHLRSSAKSKVSSPGNAGTRDEWSEFSTVNLSRYS